MKKPPNPRRLLVEGVNDKHVLGLCFSTIKCLKLSR